MSRPSLPKPSLGHIYKPDWLAVEGMVIQISNMGAIRVQFDSGRTCWYRPGTFREHFAHTETCYVCDGKHAPHEFTVQGKPILRSSPDAEIYLKDK